MSIRVALNHKTVYKFDRLVSLSPHIVRLWPAPHCRTPILSRSIRITPEENFLNWQQDPYSNHQARLVFPKQTKELSIEIDLVAEMVTINPFDFFVEDSAGKYPFEYDTTLRKELTPYFETLPVGPKFAAWLESVPRKCERSIDFVVGLNQRVQGELKYIIRMEAGVQTPEETLTLGSGSCRDFAWLLVQALRHSGLAARFVSGYSIQLVADQKALDGPSGATIDCCDLHAWAEVYLPGAGWVGLDATCGLLAGSGYIPLAATAEPSTAAPVSGAVTFETDPKNKDDKLGQDFSVHMSVTRVHETPRVTKPYTEEQWADINRLGDEIDEVLVDGDVRMTMGGEPTFVAIDYPDDPEWNMTAVGPNKRRLGGVLIKRLRERFAHGGLLHYGQGKWYPGEQLPRWSLSCYWRKDGEPIWTDPALFGDEAKDYKYTDAHAKLFITTLAERLAVDPAFAMPGYEDIWHYLLQERRLPTNVDPLDNRLDDKETRERLARIFDQGLNKLIGYALPLQRRVIDGTVRWMTGSWFLKREHLFLLPGDSPMGFRLPLDSIPWAPPDERGMQYELDPTQPYEPLPSRNTLKLAIVPETTVRGAARDDLRERGWPQRMALEKRLRWPPHMRGPAEHRLQADPLSAKEKWERAHRPPVEENDFSYSKEIPRYDVVRSALCVEPRGGQMYVFAPPTYCLEDYLCLITAIEETARDLKMPIMVEGYMPPHDPRLHNIKVTPDPGVIEVNIHPAKSWKEQAANTEILYEEARLSRLTTEKFMLDGRHTGTGGGNHIVIGGETPADSPLLRRPHLLRSLLTFWQNHPALSYLFSGLFIGPTSQHPRIDEARKDSIYELELAFKQIPDGLNVPPWLIDRILRNILVDSTGNTHRTEFCIDKLYSPDGSTGRLGLLELRSFEMPPHWRMSLAQQLLLRALVARFWDTPSTQKLVRWDTELHDRFMLPHFVEADLNDVLYDLNTNGFGFQRDWFAPHLEFRFPVLGAVTQQNIHFEIRQALEPWHVLGEEGAPGGTARYVDSSVERVQLKVQGMVDSRHVATCNGRRIPLHPTGTPGEFVAGVRYRAWQPPSCLHPTIGVHSPLVFDLFDTWNNRAIGGCQYHVAHPGGLSADTFPVNAAAAESRRVARFFPHGYTPGVQPPLAQMAQMAEGGSRRAQFFAHGHTPGLQAPTMQAVEGEFPLTLDMRS